MKVDIPGIGGSLGECAICGQSFVKEVMLGLSAGGIRITGIDATLPVHDKCADEIQKITDGDWKKLPDGPLRQEFAKAIAEEKTTMPSKKVKPIEPEKWKWFGNAGHLIVSQWCRFHLCTQIGKHLISTVGEYWPERGVREIHAGIHDAAWLAEYKVRKGDDFDAAYMKRFGYEQIGCDRTYETMVFKTDGTTCNSPKCGCGLPGIDGSEIDSAGCNSAGEAAKNHYKLCEKFAKAAK